MTPRENRTIAAVATPQGYGGIGVIRLSGDAALLLARKLLPRADEASFSPNHSALHQLINPETGLLIDEALVTYFKAPHSFTGEDVVEISCHGSPVVLAEVIRLLASLGAALAEPGEFSLRAFLNQRIDLAQAEAIKDLIHAQSAYQAQIAIRQLHGELSTRLQPIKQSLVNLIVHFESTVEFVEDNLDPLDLNHFTAQLDRIIDAIHQLSSSYRLGRIIRSGVRLALVGKPNVGKSSIFNALLGRDRAIVTHIPGTTRDTLTEPFSINGIPIDLVDTAGIRETEDIVEQLGVERTRSAISEADFIIVVIEANASLSLEDLKLLEQIPAHLYAINKTDLGFALNDKVIERLSQHKPVLKISALTGQGIEEFKQFIYHQITSGAQTILEGAIITSERHYSALEQAVTALRQAKQDLASGLTEEIALVSLHSALKSLGIITGETLIADLIKQIFATFCIGK
jgi:tRNA modification GTPase